MIDRPGSIARNAASLFWLLLKAALILLFAGASGVIPVYQGF
jgi:hypothetical protein